MVSNILHCWRKNLSKPSILDLSKLVWAADDSLRRACLNALTWSSVISAKMLVVSSFKANMVMLLNTPAARVAMRMKLLTLATTSENQLHKRFPLP